MFVGVVALRCEVLIMECHNSHKHSQRISQYHQLITNMINLNPRLAIYDCLQHILQLTLLQWLTYSSIGYIVVVYTICVIILTQIATDENNNMKSGPLLS